MNRCTYPCDLPVQCPAGAPADNCGSGGDDCCRLSRMDVICIAASLTILSAADDAGAPGLVASVCNRL